MRRLWILLLVVATALAIAAPAIGKKPEGKPNPTAAPIAVSVTNGPWWVHEAGDEILYTVYVENKTRSTSAFVSVSVDFDDDVKTLTLGGGETDFVQFSRAVEPSDLLADGAEGEIVELVTVSYTIDNIPGPLIVVPVSTVAQAYDPCPAEGEFTNVLVTSGACIWHTDQRGDFTISVVPADLKVRNMAVTLRDHVPGNWCTPDGSGGGAYVRWHQKDATRDPLTLDVFLPDGDDTLGNNDPLGDGVCYGGGAGGATMQDGSPDSFYLWLRHDAVVTISPTS